MKLNKNLIHKLFNFLISVPILSKSIKEPAAPTPWPKDNCQPLKKLLLPYCLNIFIEQSINPLYL